MPRPDTQGEERPDINAIELLKQDHRTVEGLFESFEKTDEKNEQHRIAQQICKELKVHAHIEEEIFYPTAKAQAEQATDQVNEGYVEHLGIKMLVELISGMDARDEFLESCVTVLKEYVKHHVKEEETEMFPKIEQSGLVMNAIGAQLMEAKQAYTATLDGRSGRKARGGARGRGARRSSAGARGGRARRA